MITVVTLNPALDKIFFVDGFKVGSMFRVKKVIKSAGGKGINVSRVLSSLGAQAIATGFLAGDTGKWICDNIGSLGIENSFIWVDGETRTNINIIDRECMTETEILESGPYIKESDLCSFLDVLKDTLKRTEVLICTGGLPEGVPVDFYKTLIEMAKSIGIKTILDASGDVLIEGIKAGPDFIKPNMRELSYAYGKSIESKEDVINACEEIIKSGVGSVIASMGAQGALMVDKSNRMHIKPPKINALNAIGSGDSMTAGIAFGIVNGYSKEDMMRLGTVCAVSNTQFMEIGMINIESVEEYKKNCEIEYIL